MNWIILALLAYLGFAVVAVIDKYLLVGPIRSPVFYAATLGLVSAAAWVLFPFAPFIPTSTQLVTDLSIGLLFILAVMLYFTALKYSEASRVVPVASAFVPFFTAIIASQYLSESLTGGQLMGFILLVLGGIAVSMAPHAQAQTHLKSFGIFSLTVTASLLLAVYLSLIKYAYNEQTFIGVLVWTSAGKFITGIILLLILKSTQKKVAYHFHHALKPKALLIFISGRILGG